ncbi:MAG: hypothetical protein GF381_03210 [Candidatus Pacebacteria bacterium]|nr:hypothetical protein [Candidatus Paceibacterota bacterium]
MQTLIAGLFTDSDRAGKAIQDLQGKGYTDEISIVTRKPDGETETSQIKNDVSDGVISGMGTGALIGLVAGVITVALPGAPLFVGGPVLAAWGVSGAALGALTGGLVSGLMDLGFERERAEFFEERVMSGDVLVAVTTDDDHSDEVSSIMDNYDVVEMYAVEMEE